MKEKKDPTTLKTFSLSFFYFSSSVTRAFSSPIKGEAGRPTLRESENTRARHEHMAERQSSSPHPFTSSTRNLRSCPSFAYL